MLGVVEPDDASWLSRVFRFYSKNFSTPLHLVPQLPLEDVLRAYFEELFESLDEEDREERIEWLLMTPAEREVYQKENSEKTLGERDEKFFEQLNKEVAEGESIKRPAGPKDGMSKLAAMVSKSRARAAKLAGTSLPEAKPSLKALENVPPTLGELPEFKVEFGSPGGGNLRNSPGADLDPLAPPKSAKYL